MPHPGLNDVIGNVLTDHQPSDRSTGARAKVGWKLLSKNGPFPTSADLCDIWASNTRDVATRMPNHFDDLVASITSVGQQVPVIARVSSSDPARLEIIAGACRLAAIRQINESRTGDDQLRIKVELRDLDDKAALKIVDAENRGRSDMSVLEKARFYERAMESIYHTESALADALGLNKSTVNRTLAITRLPQEVFALIKNPHSISAGQASDFMADWNKPPLRETLIDCIEDLASKGPASAAAVFGALKRAVASCGEDKCTSVVHDGVEQGTVRRGKSGAVIKLKLGAEDVALKPLVISIGNALKAIGFK